MKGRIWWIGGLAPGLLCVCANAAHAQVGDRPVIGKHKAPIRFVPMNQAVKFFKDYHPSDVPDPKVVAGVLVVEAELAVWLSEYDHHASGPRGRRIVVIPYASGPRDRTHTLLVDDERVEITFPYNPKKLNGRFLPVTADLKGVVIKATAHVRIYGDIEVKMEVHSTRGRPLDYSYCTPFRSGGGTLGMSERLTIVGELRKDGTVHAKGKFTEADGNYPRPTYLFHLIFRTTP